MPFDTEPSVPSWLRSVPVTAPADQREDWAYEAWIEEPALKRYRKHLEAIEDRWATKDGIDREWLFDLADGPVMQFFLAVMAFGFGSTGVGSTRVKWMLERTDKPEKRLGKIREAARASAAKGWSALWDSSTHVEELGTSFGTKLLHFAGYREVQSPRPLIFDKNVYRGLLEVGVDVPSKWEQRDVYLSYLHLAERWATEAGLDAACEFGGADVIEIGLLWRGRGRARRKRLAARRLTLGLSQTETRSPSALEPPDGTEPMQ